MSMTMDKKKLTVLAHELAKDIKTADDLSALSAELTKITVKAALNAELEFDENHCRECLPNWAVTISQLDIYFPGRLKVGL